MSQVTSETSAVPDKRIPLVEIFGPTIQGEGVLIGAQTTFLRFGLCDYKCTMCDSMHAVDPRRVQANAEWLTQEEIADRIIKLNEQHDTPWVTLSGGNPCIHELGYIVDALRSEGFRTSVETQGTRAPGWLSRVDQLTISPKGPGMGAKFVMGDFLKFVNTVRYTYALDRKMSFKVVIFSQADIEFLKEINAIAKSIGIPDKVYASVGNATLPSEDEEYSIEWHRENLLNEMAMNLEDLLKEPLLSNVRYLPQLHVLLWGNRQGV